MIKENSELYGAVLENISQAAAEWKKGLWTNIIHGKV
jgi:hypothetical protein